MSDRPTDPDRRLPRVTHTLIRDSDASDPEVPVADDIRLPEAPKC